MHSLLTLAEELRVTRERTPVSPGRRVWPSEDAGSEEAEVSQKLAEALLGTADTGVFHLVCVQVRFAAGHEERSFGLLLHRKPRAVRTVRFAHKNIPELEGCASFVYEGQLDASLWEAHRDAIGDYTVAWGFGVCRERPAAGEPLQEAFQLIRLGGGHRLDLAEMGVPRVESGCGIVMQATYSTAERWLGVPRGEVQQVQHENEEHGGGGVLEGGDTEEAVHLEALLKNLSPFCASLGSLHVFTCREMHLGNIK